MKDIICVNLCTEDILTKMVFTFYAIWCATFTNSFLLCISKISTSFNFKIVGRHSKFTKAFLYLWLLIERYFSVSRDKYFLNSSMIQYTCASESPAAMHSRATWRRFSSLRPWIASWQPSDARCSAVPFPMPELAPGDKEMDVKWVLCKKLRSGIKHIIKTTLPPLASNVPNSILLDIETALPPFALNVPSSILL